MIYPPLQFALREWRQQISHRLTLPLLAAVAVLLTLSGAFGTDQHLRLVPRLLYWAVLVALTYSIGVIFGAVVNALLRERLGAVARVLLAGLVSGVGVMVCVLVLNIAFFAFVPQGAELIRFIGTVMAISVVVTAIIELVETELAHRRAEPPAGPAPNTQASKSQAPAPQAPDSHPPNALPAAPQPTDALPPILDRLPLDKRGPLVRLSVEDHYVRITTLHGEEMVLMRLADAIREVGQTPGLQVHRSHWIALSAVTAARRDKDRAILTLCTGDDIPVSRANIPRIKEAGLLPR